MSRSASRATTATLLDTSGHSWRSLDPDERDVLAAKLRRDIEEAEDHQDEIVGRLSVIGIDADDRLVLESTLADAEHREAVLRQALGEIVRASLPAGRPRWLGRVLLALVVLLIVGLLLAFNPTDSDGSARAGGPTSPSSTAATHSEARTDRTPSRWVRATLSHYGTCTYVDTAHGCDGYLGKRTACGQIVRRSSWFVAALKRDLWRCGQRLTIRYRGRTYRVTVQDRGAWRHDDRALDAAPGLNRAMGYPDLARITYRKGWH